MITASTPIIASFEHTISDNHEHLTKPLTQEETTTVLRKRNRKRKPESRAKKKERQIGPTCTSKECFRVKSKQCSQITQEQRLEIFKAFWNTMNWEQRKVYVVNHVISVPRKRVYTQSKLSRRHTTLNYYLSISNAKIQVCKKMFLQSLYLGKYCVMDWVKKEVEADMTASTLAFCIIQYLTEHCHNVEGSLIICNNGCTYQNQNVVLANALLQYAVEKGIVIMQKYLEVGHTQMECDSVHSCIESQLKGRGIHLPSDFILETKRARKNPFPYDVKQLLL
ncbi:unnamed protein product [Diabrotica balteata]|uniref:Uncharacterized protein n=1 Tax=Diabrotica balteata TaxID=107213 RepID=A0A9N9TC39_DIABA|nr:unnamed protein product [Diabrotica balteata]